MTVDLQPTDRLRSALDAVADHHQPDPQAWARIVDRIQAGDDVLIDLTDHPARSRRRPVALGIAAAILLVLAAVATGIARSDSDGSTVNAGDPKDVATGWYVPVDLPQGWTVGAVEAQRWDRRCPCFETVWTNDDDSQVLISSAERIPKTDDGITVPNDNVRPLALPGGIEGELNAPDGTPVYWDASWIADGLRHTVSARGIPTDQAEDIVRQLFDDPDPGSAPVAGLDQRESWAEPSSTLRDARVDITMRTPTGRLLRYTLLAPDQVMSLAPNYAPTDRFEGAQPLPVLAWARVQPSLAGITTVPIDYLGRWPGAAVRLSEGASFDEDGKPSPNAGEADALFASLRPATTDEWRRFAATAERRDRAVTASDTFADLVAGRTSTAPPASVPEVGNLDDLQLSVTAFDQMAPWEDAGVELTVRNAGNGPISDPTCALDHAEVALLPANPTTEASVEQIAPGADPWWSDAGPCDGGMLIEQGAVRVIRLVVRSQFLDSRLGPLPTGSYEATVRVRGEIEGSAPIEIGGPECSADPSAYLGLTDAEAESLAAERGDQVRHPEPGRDSEASRTICTRINLVVDGGVVTFARYY